jgi:hypothetical protein
MRKPAEPEIIEAEQESDKSAELVSQPYPALRLEDGSIIGVAHIVGLRVLSTGQINHVQVLISGFQDFVTHMSTRDINVATERFNYLSTFLCDTIIEPVIDPIAVPPSLGAVPHGMPRRGPQAQYGGFAENRMYPNPTTVNQPAPEAVRDNPLYVTPERLPAPINDALPPSKWGSSVTIAPKPLPAVG